MYRDIYSLLDHAPRNAFFYMAKAQDGVVLAEKLRKGIVSMEKTREKRRE